MYTFSPFDAILYKIILGVLWMVHPHNVNTDPCTDLQNLGLGKPGGPAARQGGRVSFGASLTLCYPSIIFYGRPVLGTF